jgi:hypothetical protein
MELWVKEGQKEDGMNCAGEGICFETDANTERKTKQLPKETSI